jgi:hypothetical protein
LRTPVQSKDTEGRHLFLLRVVHVYRDFKYHTSRLSSSVPNFCRMWRDSHTRVMTRFNRIPVQ